MTKTSDPEAIDINAIVARHFAEQADHNSRVEALRPANKAFLFDALAAAGITHVVVTFDGYSDSGQVEDIDARAGDETVALPTTEISISSPVWGSTEVTRHTMILEAAIEQLAYDFLSETHGGWGNNDGAYGEFTFDVASQVISLEHNERYTATETFSHEF